MRAAVDLLHGRHDLRGGAGQFLNRRRKLLGGRADLLGGRYGCAPAAKLFRQCRERARGDLSLFERLGLLLDRRLRLARAGGLLFGGAGDLLGALLRVGRGPFCFERRVQHLLADLRDSSHVLSSSFEGLHDGIRRLGFAHREFSGFFHGDDRAADIDSEFRLPVV